MNAPPAILPLAKRAADHLKGIRSRLRVSSREQLLAQLLPSAYWHPNNFLKLRIAEDKDGASFRLHLWPVGCEQAHDDIHSHRWDYHSTVLHGALHVETYQESDEGQTLMRRFICSPNHDGAYSFVDDGPIKLHLVSTGLAAAGNTHNGWASTIHRTSVAGKGPVLSAFMQSAAISSRSHVYCDSTVQNRPTTQLRRPTQADLQLMVELLLKSEENRHD